MKSTVKKLNRFKAVFLSAVIVSMLLLPIKSQAEESQKVVRVGWYESSFNITDESGRKSGYAYEYQLKIASYAGWKYEYITGSWSNLKEMLKAGEIDLLSDVSYTEERAKEMLFPDLPMGTEEYYIFIAPDNNTITADDYSTLSGKKIGVNKGTIQLDFYEKWAETHGVNAEVIELTSTENESIKMLSNGQLDAYITPNVHVDASKLKPLSKIGYSDFYFAVNKNRPDLLTDLNTALSRIQGDDPYYNKELFEKHVQTYGANAFLSNSEKTWLSSHDKIRVGYQDNYLAFCAKDQSTGELTGALKDFLKNAEDCLSGSHIDFETIAYPTSKAALDALNQGEIDCVFPINFDSYDGEMQKLLITPSLISSDVYEVVRVRNQKVFTNNDHIVVAVNKSNPNYDSFLNNNFQNWVIVYYETSTDCLKAVSNGIADCMMISSYRYNNISKLCEKYRLTTYSTGTSIDYCFAVSQGETELYSILSKMIGVIPTSSVNSALSIYVANDSKISLGDFLIDNIGILSIITTVLLILIFSLLIRSWRSEKKAKKLILSTETDDLTGLYNRDYFFEYANRVYREQRGTPRDAIVINIEQFHSINEVNGRNFGNSILQILGSEISDIAKENDGIAGRFGADRFDIYCQHLNDYRSILERLQKRVDDFSANVSVRIRMGVMPWQAKLEPIQLFDRARTACNMARGHYNKHLIIFNEKLHDQEVFDHRLINDLQRALLNFEFEVYYQPKYDISADTPKLVGAEALIRWQHPELGIITPDNFVPLFEKNGMISKIDKYVWEQVTRQIARWKSQFGITLPISVNLSRIDVFDSSLEQNLDDIIKAAGISRQDIKLEVTESAYTENPSQVIKVIQSLRRKSYTVEMDDFGTGYSSLNMLSEMPVDVLKMDRSFVRNIEASEKDVQLIALILGIAKTLNISVVAEGVETEAQLKILKDLGCTIVQGYYFSRPLHPSEFESKILQELK